MKKLILLGCTGSIGRQAIEVIRNLKNTEFEYKLVGISINKNIVEAEKYIREFMPAYVAVADENAAKILKNNIKDLKTEVFCGKEGIINLCKNAEYDLCVNGIVGIAGLLPTIAAIRAKRDVALANKETLVTAGDIVMQEAKENGVSVLPLDSEHSAIFQCLQGGKAAQLNKIILTASGGPFFGWHIDELKCIKKEQALKHPSWNMGAKITVDCATLMNKGLEVIEAVRLFSLPEDRIDVVIHRESIIHSMIEYKDCSVIAQMGAPDMRVPIQYGLTYPDRTESPVSHLNLVEISKLTFFKPDEKTFKSLSLARQAIRTGGTAPTILNAANEVAVDRFLKDEIGFCDIADMVEEALNNDEIISRPTLAQIMQTDDEIRKKMRT